MRQGGLCFQALAVFTPNVKGSFLEGKKQVQAFHDLLTKKPENYRLWKPDQLFLGPQGPISTAIAFENACSFSEEDSPLQESFDFLENVLEKHKSILYISLTWDGENRFGGGTFSKAGLKEDAKTLLQWMDKKNIALDLSHASDYLATDAIEYIDKKSLKIPILASHCNARAICPKDRNLPPFLIEEIVARKGLIGLNFFAPFIGKKVQDLILQAEYFYQLGAQDCLCFGADFFYEKDLSYLTKKYQTTVDFFPELANSSCYPFALKLLDLSGPFQEKLSYKNLQNYLKRTFCF
jgi:microsomal dipeptidase-like Zn-dependent dipeptidase